MLYTTTRAKDATAAGIQGDWWGVGANVAGGIGKTGWYLRDKIQWLKDGIDVDAAIKADPNKKFPTPTPTFIVDVAMIVVGVIDASMGMWVPARGHEFETGSVLFGSMYKSLQLAEPNDDKWSGDAATDYAAANKALQDLAKKMQEVDKAIEAALESQADVVQQAHTILEWVLMGLTFAQLAAMVLWAAPWAGPAVSVGFQKMFVLASFLTVTGAITYVAGNSHRNGTALNKLAGDCKDVGQKAKTVKEGTFATIVIDEAKESTVSSFEDISASMSGSSAMPDLATLVNIAGANASAGENPLLSAFTGDGETPGTLAGPSITEDETPSPDPSTPGFTMPTAAQVTAISSQAAKISGHLSQHMNLFNQTMGQAQQIASMAQQGQGAGAPAEEAAAEEATLAGDVEGARAGLETEAAERAPIDAVPVGPGQAQEGDPVEAHRVNPVA